MSKLDWRALRAEVLEPLQQHAQPTAAGGVRQTTLLTWVGLYVGPEQVLAPLGRQGNMQCQEVIKEQNFAPHLFFLSLIHILSSPFCIPSLPWKFTQCLFLACFPAACH